MSKRIEIEKKFYCNDFELLISYLEKNKFELQSTSEEEDEYFTDLDGEFIHNRTCLRIRTTNHEQMELTFKGKSKKLSSMYAKAESNIGVPVVEYDNLKGVLSSLGYYSYTIVSKKRSTYSYKEDSLIYNVMIDQISNIGNFVEFEILAYDEYTDIDSLKNKLNMMIDKFNELKFDIAHLPYRDFVAEKIYRDILPANQLEAIFFDLDGTLINSEEAFYQSFRCVLKDKYQVEINKVDYKKYELDNNASLISHLQSLGKLPINIDETSFMNDVYRIYSDKFKILIQDVSSIINFELIRKLKEKKLVLGLISTSKKEFIENLLSTLNLYDIFDVVVSREDVVELKPSAEAYIKALHETNFDKLSTSVIAIEDSKRGVDSSIAAGIKTIKVNEFNFGKESDPRTVEIDSITRLLLILNIYL